MPPVHPAKERLFLVLAVLLVVCCTIFATEMALRLWTARTHDSEAMDPGLIRYHSTLGWQLTPGWQGTHSHYDFTVDYRISPYGFRGHYSSAASGNTIVMLGDSFTFGLGVEEYETFSVLLEKSASPQLSGLTVVNGGTPGYSTDQELLFLHNILRQLRPKLVVLIVYLGNDLLDNSLPYPVQADQAKPYFTVEEGELHLNNSPVPQESKTAGHRARTLTSVLSPPSLTSPLRRYLNRFHLGRYLTSWWPVSDASLLPFFHTAFTADINLFAHIVRQMHRETQKHNTQLAVALLPGRSALAHPMSISSRYQQFLTDRISDHPLLSGLPLLPIADSMRHHYSSRSTPWYHPHEGNLTPAGHNIVATLLAPEIERLLARQRP